MHPFPDAAGACSAKMPPLRVTIEPGKLCILAALAGGTDAFVQA